MNGRPESYGHPGADTPDFTLPYRRPWNLLMTSQARGALFDARTNNALVRIFDLLPHLTWITVETAAGDVRVSRDMMHEYTDEVDRMLAAVFDAGPEITGIVFPATTTRPEHKATPARPHFMDRQSPADGR